MELIARYLDCNISAPGCADIVDLHVVKFTDITAKIIPFFQKGNHIAGVKQYNFLDFIKVADIMKVQRGFLGHLSEKGLETIRNIKSNMNDQRLTDNRDPD